MSNKIIVNATVTPPTYFIKSSKQYTSLTQRRLSKEIPNFQDMEVLAQKRHLRKWLNKEAEIVCCATLGHIPNIHRKGIVPYEVLPSAAQIFLAGTEMFEDPAAGYRIIADILCGQHMSALRGEVPSFQAITSIASDSHEIEALLTSVVQAVVTRRKWSGKHCKLKRDAILDYRDSDSLFQRQIQDHSELTIRYKGKVKVPTPYPYIDTVALVIGANTKQAREAAPYLQDAAVILLNSNSIRDVAPTKLSRSSTSFLNPDITLQFQKARAEIASILYWWWAWFEDEDTWAKQIIQTAQASFGKPDSRYIRVEVDPIKLRDAIRYQVFLSFLEALEQAWLMPAEELEPYRQGAKNVFDPAPPEPVQHRHAEDPGVFLELMQELVQDPSFPIIAEGEPFVKTSKPAAAWRTISKERYLVLEEGCWSKLYMKTARAKKDINTSFFQTNKWDQQLQKRLCEAGIIKQPSSGFRMRYDLFGTGDRNNTHIIAIHAELLD